MGNEDCALLLLDADKVAADNKEEMEIAIGKDESRVVEALIRRGAQVDDSLPSGTTPLDEAAFKGAIRTVRVLLNNDANPNLAGHDGTTPLENACLKGFAPVVSLLLDYGALVNDLGDRSGTTPLYAAASFGKGDVVKLLLERGANPSLCGKNDRSPYQAALANGYSQVANQIRDYGGAIGCKE
jgi:ankyrin repeat protein